ncbi:hypothetical protein LOD99_4075 [Oopsacas minuta]|uniref:Helitron helicase-like domain-containing protein n=1 Tax=Oopsacas minuta TaxID=111878 RepID=A0AAV7JVM6_9METZ|nr:hypothetical protein LOD99_4075 [Oopsacas minuta]
MRNINAIDIKFTILEGGIGDPRTCSAPSALDIAVLLPGDGYSETVINRDIVLSDGWHINIPNSKSRGTVTALDFYCYQLMVRSGLNHLHLSGRQFHQYIVNMYAKIEQQRLKYIKLNQQQILVDLYSGLADALARGDAEVEELGQKIILP